MAYLPKLFKYIDDNQDLYVTRLAEWVAIQSVSALPEKRSEIIRMVELVSKEIEKLGGSVELAENGQQTVECSNKDLHSGVFGGTVHEAMTDLIYLLGKLVDKTGKLLVPGVYESVAPLTDEEKKLYDKIDFDIEEYCKDIGASQLLQSTKEQVLMHRWRYPSLSLHGIEGAFAGSGAKTVIPRKVTGKFSIRLVPNMDPEVVGKQVVDYIQKLFAERGSPNTMKVYMGHGAKAWLSDYNHPHYRAGRNAIKTVFGVEPDMTREGGSIPVTLTFQEATGKNVLLLPIGAADDGAHSQNEKINRTNYIQGIKMLGAYFHEISCLK
ncbi:cytosolic non-specific dipeptidase isoform X2 [Mobula birostris]|uniref:cytosolic non-specific dipeptidase isoform X2 n=1 Tax=Mobula birostris TaxID=1983395 RepID=UPI003B286B92